MAVTFADATPLARALRSSRYRARKLRNRIDDHLPPGLVDPSRKFARSSFSQFGEDLIIGHVFDLLGVPSPTYLDIGAHDPFALNNTARLYLAGSRGVNVEPDPTLFARFEPVRPRDVNLNIGIGPEAGEFEFFILDAPVLNTFSAAEADHAVSLGHRVVETRTVEVRTIGSVVDEHLGGRAPDLLSVDVEGLDFEIVASIDFDRHRPRVICAETVEYSLGLDGRRDGRITELLEANGYRVYADTWVNTIYLDRR